MDKKTGEVWYTFNIGSLADILNKHEPSTRPHAASTKKRYTPAGEMESLRGNTSSAL